MARASATRCFWPPESWPGLRCSRLSMRSIAATARTASAIAGSGTPDAGRDAGAEQALQGVSRRMRNGTAMFSATVRCG